MVRIGGRGPYEGVPTRASEGPEESGPTTFRLGTEAEQDIDRTSGLGSFINDLEAALKAIADIKKNRPPTKEAIANLKAKLGILSNSSNISAAHRIEIRNILNDLDSPDSKIRAGNYQELDIVERHLHESLEMRQRIKKNAKEVLDYINQVIFHKGSCTEADKKKLLEMLQNVKDNAEDEETKDFVDTLMKDVNRIPVGHFVGDAAKILNHIAGEMRKFTQ
jgi:hypothetical protein